MSGAASQGLLDPAFLRELGVLRRRLQVRARSGGIGSRVARRRGAGIEFEDHRAYSPGDDATRMDWMAFARGGVPVLKQFRAEEDVVIRLVLDASASLGHGQPSKLDVARRVAAALGYLALASGERTELSVAQAGTLSRLPERRGQGGVSGLLRDLSSVAPSGGAALTTALEKITLTARRPGLLVVLSDFLEPGPVLEALRRAASAGNDLALVQILAPDELEPTFEGDLALVDAETGERLDVTLDERAIRAYRARLDALIASLRGVARSTRSSSHVLARTDEPLEGIVRRIVVGEARRGAA